LSTRSEYRNAASVMFETDCGLLVKQIEEIHTIENHIYVKRIWMWLFF